VTTEDVPWDTGDGAFVTTIKGGKGYDAPWIVIKGSSADSLRQRVIAAFGLDGHGEATLVDAVHNASAKFQAMTLIGNRLGGRVIDSDPAPANDPWEAAESAPPDEPEDPNKRLLDEIDRATTVDQLKRFWVDHNPLNEVVQAAWSAKGKKLKEGGSN
jgi:hypothetical protein